MFIYTVILKVTLDNPFSVFVKSHLIMDSGNNNEQPC